MTNVGTHGCGYVELHTASAFSFLRSPVSPEALVARAAAIGIRSLALTDYMTLAGVVRFQAACAQQGIQPIVGAELAVADPVFGITPRPAHVVALAENARGYARLCRLLTDANLASPEAPVITWKDLQEESDGLILLTGGREGTLMRLLLAGRRQQAEEVAARYRADFGPERVYVELQHHRLVGDHLLLRQLVEVANAVGIPCVATNGAHQITREDHALYNLMTCARLGITVDQPHAERPRNDEAYLKSASEMVTLFRSIPRGRAALRASNEIAERCQLSLLKTSCTAPQIPQLAGVNHTAHLHMLCEQGLQTRYTAQPEALWPGGLQRQQLAHELAVIAQLHLEEFFLCVD